MNIRTQLLVAIATTFLAAGAVNAEVVVVVSADSPVTTITKDQAAQIFLKKSVNLPGGVSATPVDQASGAARGEFYNKVTGKDEAQLKAYWAQLTFTGKAQRPKQAASPAEARKLIAASPGAIGYLAPADVDASVRVVLKP